MKLIEITKRGYDLNMRPDNRWILPSCFVGLEVEVEGIRSMALDRGLSQYWERKADGSLRGTSCEWVSRPLFGADLSSAMDAMGVWLAGTTHTMSYRCGLHVHMNVADLTFEQLRALIAAYLASERLLFSYAGVDRMKNPYCVPLCDTPDFVNGVAYIGMVDHRPAGDSEASVLEHQLFNAVNNGAKYQALNILPILTMGTVEFRHARGTSDIKWIETWVNILMCLKRAAITMTACEIADLSTTGRLLSVVYPEYEDILTPHLDSEWQGDLSCSAKTFAYSWNISQRVDELRVEPPHPAFEKLDERRDAYLSRRRRVTDDKVQAKIDRIEEITNSLIED